MSGSNPPSPADTRLLIDHPPGLQRNWARPQVACDPRFRDILVGWARPLAFTYRVEPGKKYRVAFGLIEGYHAEPGLRPLEIRIEGQVVRTVDLVREFGKNQPAVLCFDAEDRNHNGLLEMGVYSPDGAQDKNTILSALWVFDAANAPSESALREGKADGAALAIADISTTARQGNNTVKLLFQTQDLGSRPGISRAAGPSSRREGLGHDLRERGPAGIRPSRQVLGAGRSALRPDRRAGRTHPGAARQLHSQHLSSPGDQERQPRLPGRPHLLSRHVGGRRPVHPRSDHLSGPGERDAGRTGTPGRSGPGAEWRRVLQEIGPASVDDLAPRPTDRRPGLAPEDVAACRARGESNHRVPPDDHERPQPGQLRPHAHRLRRRRSRRQAPRIYECLLDLGRAQGRHRDGDDPRQARANRVASTI